MVGVERQEGKWPLDRIYETRPVVGACFWWPATSATSATSAQMPQPRIGVGQRSTTIHGRCTMQNCHHEIVVHSVLRDSTDLPFSLLKEVVVQARVMGEVSVLLMGHLGLCRWDEGGDVRLVMTFELLIMEVVF